MALEDQQLRSAVAADLEREGIEADLLAAAGFEDDRLDVAGEEHPGPAAVDLEGARIEHRGQQGRGAGHGEGTFLFRDAPCRACAGQHQDSSKAGPDSRGWVVAGPADQALRRRASRLPGRMRWVTCATIAAAWARATKSSSSRSICGDTAS